MILKATYLPGFNNHFDEYLRGCFSVQHFCTVSMFCPALLHCQYFLFWFAALSILRVLVNCTGNMLGPALPHCQSFLFNLTSLSIHLVQPYHTVSLFCLALPDYKYFFCPALPHCKFLSCLESLHCKSLLTSLTTL